MCDSVDHFLVGPADRLNCESTCNIRYDHFRQISAAATSFYPFLFDGLVPEHAKKEEGSPNK